MFYLVVKSHQLCITTIIVGKFDTDFVQSPTIAPGSIFSPWRESRAQEVRSHRQ